MSPPAKRRKSQPIRYPCHGCGAERIGSQFPDSLPTAKCTHLINICLTCFRQYVDRMMENTLFIGKIRCPQCTEWMEEEALQLQTDEGAIKKTTMAKITELNNRKAAEQNPNWRWCLNVACKSGQEHKPATTSSEDQTVSPFSFVCEACGHHACTKCNRAWHEDESCEQYAKRTGGKHAVDEAASIKRIKKITKACPNPRCGLLTEKNGGCSSMYCTRCATSWCWECCAVYDPNTGCKCKRMPHY